MTLSCQALKQQERQELKNTISKNHYYGKKDFKRRNFHLQEPYEDKYNTAEYVDGYDIQQEQLNRTAFIIDVQVRLMNYARNNLYFPAMPIPTILKNSLRIVTRDENRGKKSKQDKD